MAPENGQTGGFLKNAFQSAIHYVCENKVQSAALAVSLLLGATALTTPLIATAGGAAVILGGSLCLLVQNAKTLVPNIIALGKKQHLSAMTLGIMLGSLNTVPEVLTTMQSAFQNAIELGIANVTGSNVVHNLFILGMATTVAGLAKTKDLSWRFNALMMTGGSALFASQFIYGSLTPAIGAVMLGLGGWYLQRHFFSHHGHKQEQEHKHDSCHHHDHEHHHEHDEHDHHEHDEYGHDHCHGHSHIDEEEEIRADRRPRWLNLALSCVAMAGLLAASGLAVESAVNLADKFNFAGFHLSQAAIGAAIIATGGALPEVFITLDAIKKRQGDLAVGNVLGCGVVNTLFAGGALCLMPLISSDFNSVVPEVFRPHTASGIATITAFVGSSALLTATLMATKGALNRWQGALALTSYVAYLGGAIFLSDGKTLPTHEHGRIEPPQIAHHIEKPRQSPVIRPS